MSRPIPFHAIASGRDRVMVAVDISGHREVLERLKQFSDKEAARIGAKAMRKVAAAIRGTMKRLSPRQHVERGKKPGGQIARPGTLRKQIIASKYRRVMTGTVFTKVLLGTRKMMGIDPRSKWYYPAFMEFGFKIREPKKIAMERRAAAWNAYYTTKSESKLDGWTHNQSLHRAGKARREVLNAGRRKIPGLHFVERAKRLHERDLLPAVNAEIDKAIAKLNQKAAA
jgi:hypothetical protein